MPILIDGWNLVRCEASSLQDYDALDSAKALISYLEHFQEAHNDPIVLVFDSTNEFLGIDYQNTAKLKMVASRDADEYIKRYIDRTPDRQRRNVRVVSSDRDVYYYARSAGAIVLKSTEFWKKLNGDIHV